MGILSRDKGLQSRWVSLRLSRMLRTACGRPPPQGVMRFNSFSGMSQNRLVNKHKVGGIALLRATKDCSAADPAALAALTVYSQRASAKVRHSISENLDPLCHQARGVSARRSVPEVVFRPLEG